MNEQEKREKREKVIKGLEEVIAEAIYPDRPRKFMMSLELAEDALTLLKSQEPRVMTLEELDSHKVGEPLFYESRIVYPCWVIHLNSKTTDRIHFIGAVGNIYKAKEEYCVHWRCWTSRPTDEQREAIPWN